MSVHPLFPITVTPDDPEYEDVARFLEAELNRRLCVEYLDEAACRDEITPPREFISALHRGGYYSPPEKWPKHELPADALFVDHVDEIVQACEAEKAYQDALIHGQGWLGPDGHIPLRQVIKTQPPRFWRRQWQRFNDRRARIAFRLRAWWYRFF